MKNLKLFIEKNAFGVCSFLGKQMQIPSSYIRLFFIYTTFVSMTSPVIFYLITAFIINLKKYLSERSKWLVD